MRLAWELYVVNLRTRELFQMLVDAQTSAVLVRHTRTSHISDATYNVYTSDSPSPFSPGWPTPNTGQPPLTNRVLVTISALDTTASPNGWIDDGNNTLRGNNADTFVDRDFDQVPDGPAVQGNPNRVFDFPLDLTLAPIDYTNAATTQLFYLINTYHDRLHQLGFTESFGNFQDNNFGRGGAGNDHVIGYVQAGADIGVANNAAFGTPPDGFSGEMYMFVFNFPAPDRDGSLDAEIVWHEASHGTSSRMVGGGSGITRLQTAGMGEGWSDFYGLCLLSEPADDPDAAYAAGGYLTFQFGGLGENYYFGIRRYPYCTDLTKNPLTFKDIDPGQAIPHGGVPSSPIFPFNSASADEVHNQGEVWCVALWDVRANLVRKYGFTGNQLTLQLVTDAMKLCPVNPNFLESRDAILLAEQVNNGGTNTADIWAGFAKRGMGISATSPDSSTTAGVREAFDVPGLQVVTNYLSGGNGNGVIDFNECNNFQVVLQNNLLETATGISVRLATPTPRVTFGSKVSTYPNILSGETATNSTPLTISTAPDFICGTPIDIDVIIKADQLTSTVRLTLPTGTNGLPVRFDGTGLPIVVPDADPRGTNASITVSNIIGAVSKVSLSLFMTHTFDSDMLIELVSPDGTTVTLSANNGGAGDNFGVACTPESLRTTFDDEARASITTSLPPFNGSFRPEEPLDVFIGKYGTNVNGVWKLRLVDQARIDIGVLQCWSLFISPAGCVDGGGECPGSDMSIGMRASPEPVVIGNNLTYSIAVTNFGPSTAKGITVTHVLPPSAVFVSATASQGTAVQSGGTVVGSLGNLSVGATATMTVVVTPTAAGLISSSAAVASSQVDPDSGNNSVTVVSHVNPPSADLAVGLADAPDPALVGGGLTYLVSVTNKGPSIASGVRVTNSLPDSVTIQNVSVSQGVVSVDGHTVVITFGSITNNGIATAGIQVTPTVEGTITAGAVVSGNLPDPVLPNNTAVTATTVGAAADLGVSLLATPDPVVFGSNLTYIVTVTNRGPSAATSVLVSQTLPTGVTVISSNTTQGTFTLTNATLSCAVGNMPIGGSVSIIVVVRAGAVGTLLTTVNVAGAQADPNSADNDASASTVVAPPFVSVVAAGATLTGESLSPPNGTVDPGETVTVELRLRNAGNVANTNLVATLLATGGVTSPSGPQTYGAMPAGSFPVSKPFTFTASGAFGGSVVATLQLQDGANNLGTVNFTFLLPNVFTFSNTNGITIPDEGNASPYPATISVSGVTGLVSKVTATFVDFTHTFPHDVNALLTGPTGADVLLMSHVADGSSVADADVILDDTASAALPASGSIGSGSWRPAAYPPSVVFGSPAPNPPHDTVLSAFNGLNPNGTWSLFVKDDSAGDQGGIGGGWRLAITTVTPVNQVADIGVTGTAAPNPSLVGNTLTYSFTVNNGGPGAASSVAFTNVLPPSLAFVSASASQGSATANGNTAIVNLGALSAGASATVTIVARPLAAGSIANTATVTSPESDLNLANNSLTVTSTVNLPVADVALANVSAPEPVVVGSNLTYTLTVTNAGPNNALNVTVSDSLPAGINYVSGSASQGSVSESSGTVTATLGTLLPGTIATVTINAIPTIATVVTNTATVVTASNDGNTANNTAVAVTTVANPAPKIVAAGSTLVSESQRPANGAIDSGETISISLALANVGSADTANLVATLQPTGGVNSPSGPQSYGVLVRGGPSVARTFTFNATAGSGLIVARLQLQDGATDLGTVSFVYSLPITTSFANATPIQIPDHGSALPYPSTIAVSGVTGVVDKVTVTLNGLTHGFPDDVNVMLVGPGGEKMILQSGAGGGHAVTNVNLGFDDAAGTSLPDSEQIVDGTYSPTNYKGTVAFPPPAPAGAAPATLSVFNGGTPNGTWALYVFDDTSGDAGNISGGWSLSIRTVVPINPLADLAISMSGNSGPVYTGSGVIYNISVVNNGPANATNVVVTDALPVGMNLVSVSASQGSYSNANGVITFNLGELNSGANAMASILVSPAIAGVASNAVNVSANELDVDPVNNLDFVLTTVVAPLPATLTISPTNAQFQLVLTGEPGQTYVIQASSNFTSWVPVHTDVAVGGTLKFTTTDAQSFLYRFYRAVRVP
jgi:uncharacterized repeat protein (TIGR01451 family)